MLAKIGRKYDLSVVSGLIPINSSAEGKLLLFITILQRRITADNLILIQYQSQRVVYL